MLVYFYEKIKKQKYFKDNWRLLAFFCEKLAEVFYFVSEKGELTECVKSFFTLNGLLYHKAELL